MLISQFRISLCILTSIFLLQGVIVSQNKSSLRLSDEFPFKHIEYINSEHGLSGNDVSWIEQDRSGFMWLMTENGLNRYDGYSFRYWPARVGDKNMPLAFSEEYTGLTDDQNGVLWFSNGKEGIYSFDPMFEKFTNYRHLPDVKSSLSHNRTNAIAVGNDGVVWIATSKGLDKFDPSTGSFSYFKQDDEDSQHINRRYIKAIMFEEGKDKTDKQDDLWLINSKLEIECFHVPAGEVVKRFTFPFQLFNGLSPDDATININRVKNGVIWIGSNDGGIYGFDIKNEKFIQIKINRQCSSNGHVEGFYNVLEDRKGNLWTVSDDNELVYYDQAIQKFYFYKVPLNKARFLDYNVFFFEDKNYRIWIGAENGLVSVVPTQQPFFISGHVDKKALSVSGNYFFGLTRTRQGEILVGAVPLNVFDPKSKSLSSFKFEGNIDKLDVYAVRFIYQDDKDIVWLTGDFGIIAYDPQTQKGRLCQLYDGTQRVPNKGFRGVIVDKKNDYWAVNQLYGLYKFDPVTGKARRFIIASTSDSLNITDFTFGFLDSKNNLYLGRSAGAFVSFNPDNGLFNKYSYNKTDSISRSNESTTGFVESKNGLIWFSTLGRGLGVYDPANRRFKFFTTADGLKSDVAYSLVQDKKGRLWTGTLKGITGFVPPEDPFDETQKIHFWNYNSSDGLPLNRCSYSAVFCDYDGTLYFGTRGGGLVYFHPDSLVVNETLPPVFITDILLKNKRVTAGDSSILTRSIEYTKEIRLSYQENMISFSFVALNFNHPEKNQYAYMLKGYDEDWIETDVTRRFANYTNLAPGQYTFMVKGSNNDGRWNETPTEIKIIITPPFWQRTWFGVLVALIVIGIVYAFYRYRVRQILMMQKMRNKIAADLHDDIGSTLNSIALYSDLAKKQPAQRDHALNMIGANSRKIIDSMSDIVWMINPKNDNFDKIIFRMRSSAHDLLKAKRIEYLFKSDETLNELSLPMGIRRNIYLIFKEALNNLLKYSNATRASIKMLYINENLVLLISDNGVGFDSSVSYNGNGISNMIRRAEEIGGRIKIESAYGAGTNIELNVKL